MIPLEQTFEGWFGLEWLALTRESAHVRFEVRENLKQPLGLMHGGIYCRWPRPSRRWPRSGGVWRGRLRSDPG